MKFSHLLALCGFALIAMFGTSCAGYRLGSVKPSALSHIESVAVPVFKNDTLEPRVQVLVTNEVIKQMQRDGSYSIADPKRGGDAILHGTIIEIDRRQLRGSRTDVLRTREIEITLRLDYVLEDAESGAELNRGTISGTTGVYLDPNFQLTERQAIQLAAEDAAQKLAAKIAEGY